MQRKIYCLKHQVVAILLLFCATNIHSQLSEIREFEDAKIKTFVTNGLPKSKGLNISIEYPASYVAQDINDEGIVQSFKNQTTGVFFYFNVFRKEGGDFSQQERARYMSKENFQNAILIVNKDNQFLNYKDDIKVSSTDASYAEYISKGNGVEYIRQYFIVGDNFLISLVFTIPQVSNPDIARKGKFNAYGPFFELVVKSIRIEKADVPGDEGGTWNGEFYRNRENKFSVAFPKDWKYDKGKSKSVVARAVDKAGIAIFSIGIFQQQPVNSADSSNIYSKAPTDTSEMNQQLKSVNTRVEKYKFEKASLDNIPAYIYEYTNRKSTDTSSFLYVSKQVQCINKNKLYVLAFNLPAEEWTNERMILFDLFVKSFKFE